MIWLGEIPTGAAVGIFIIGMCIFGIVLTYLKNNE